MMSPVVEPVRQAIKSKPVIVLGVERSGTSLVTEMVHRWGAFAGEPGTLYGGDERNPQGFWEYRPLWDFTGKLCGSLGISWWDAAFRPPAREKEFLSEHRGKARDLVAAMEKDSRVWVWKYPDLTYFMPFWKEIWGDAAYVITVRDPYESARSWDQFVAWQRPRRSLNLIAGNILRWQLRMLSILEQTDGAENRLFISYEKLVQNPQQEAQRLHAFLNGIGADTPRSTQSVDTMAQAISSKLWRNRSDRRFDDVEEATAEQKALYRYLQRKAQDLPAEYQPEKWPIYPGALDLAKNQELFTEYYNLSERLLSFFPVQMLLALFRPVDYLTYATEVERFVAIDSPARRSLKALAAVGSRARCRMMRTYFRAKRLWAGFHARPVN